MVGWEMKRKKEVAQEGICGYEINVNSCFNECRCFVSNFFLCHYHPWLPGKIVIGIEKLTYQDGKESL